MLDVAPHTRLDASATARHGYARRGKAGRGTALEIDEIPQCYCNSEPRWTVVHTHPQAERWADANLRRRGYPTYLPLYSARVQDRVLRTLTRTVERPLWPGYVFVQHEPETSWRPIYETPGVAAMLRNGSQLQYVPHGALEAVQSAQATAAIRLPLAVQWAPGMPCSLATGPFADHQAVVLSIGHDMATVAILMLGHLREVALQLDCLRPRDE
jgi:transcription antitermination factor NusG